MSLDLSHWAFKRLEKFFPVSVIRDSDPCMELYYYICTEIIYSHTVDCWDMLLWIYQRQNKCATWQHCLLFFSSVPNHNYISFTSWLLCLPLFLASIQRYVPLKACRSGERVKVSSSCFYQPPLHKSSQLCDQAFGGKANQTGWKKIWFMASNN